MPSSLADTLAPVAGDREFDFTDADFECIRRLIRERAGIALGPSKRNMAYSRVSRLVRGAGMASFREYLHGLESGGDADAAQTFVNALTTNLTSFFREAHHFPLLVQHLREQAPASPLTLWCAASSTGEEPWSIAMAACEAFDSLTPPVRVVATDIDTHVLAVAARGIYPMDRVEPVGPARLQRFFLRGTRANAGFARVRRELQALVEFRQLNLLDPFWPVPQALAAIFCRNVLIYFDRPTQHRIVSRFAPLLASGGLLFAGHSENLAQVGEFTLRGHTVYQRSEDAAA